MRLHVLTGPSKGVTAEIAGERFVVGRDDGCDLVLRDGTVARRHASFEAISPETWILRDLGSAAGTFVGGQRLEGPIALRGNENLRFGSVEVGLEPASDGEAGRRRRRFPLTAVTAAVVVILGAGAVGAVVATRGDEEPSFFDAAATATSASTQAPAGTAPAGDADPAAPDIAAPLVTDGPAVIAFARGDDEDAEIRVMNPDGTSQAVLAVGTAPAISPDGGAVAFVQPDGAVAAAPAAGGTATTLLRRTASGGRPLAPDWAPDGSWLVVADSEGGIELVAADGSDERSLGSGRAESPSWSADGSTIALAARVSGDSTVVGTIATDGSNPAPLATVDGLDGSEPAGVDWSPDGKRLAFTCSTEDGDGTTRADVCVMAADGSGLRALGGSAGSDGDPAWSPDGARIAFVSDRDGNDEIYVMDADGGSQRRLTVDPAADRDPSWGGAGPAGRRSAAPVALVDDFSPDSSGWEVFGDDQGASAAYDDGGFVLRMPKPGYVVTSDSGRRWEGGASIEVTARSTGAAADAAFGVVCRYQDQRNFTILGITADGRAAIARWVNGVETVLTSGGAWAPADGVDAGASAYRLRAECTDERLTLSVDGTRVASAPAAGPDGTVGLFTETFDQGGTEIRFDDMLVSAPSRARTGG